MAFTPEERARIKERAQQLVAEGMAPGQAAQSAASELFTQDEILQRFSPPEVPQTRSPDVQRIDTELKDAETDFRRERTRQLEAQGLTPEIVEETVRQELEQYRAPAPLGFGTPEERRTEDIGVPFSFAALTESRRAVTPIGEQQEPTGINYDIIGEQFAEAFGTSKEEGIADAYAFRDLIVEPRLRQIRTQGGAGALIDDEVSAIEEGFSVLEDMYGRIQDKERYIQAPDRVSPDIWIRTFSRQVDPGEGVPDLTPQQISFLNAREQRRIQNVIAERVEDQPTKMVIVSETGEETPFERGMRIENIPEGSNVERRLLTRDEIAEQVFEEQADALPWWMDPQKKVEVIANPQEFEERGFLSTTTPYGTQRESTANYLLRSALTIPNVLAGAVAGGAYGSGGLGTERAARREAEGFTPDLGGAILQNVAQNRGFFGEAQEAADITGLTGLPRYVVLGGGFAADLLDPSIDGLKAFVAGGKTAKVTSDALRRVTDLRTGGIATEAGIRAGVRDFMDNYIGAKLIETAYEAKTGKRFVAGDPRTVAGNLLTDEYQTLLTINEQMARGRGADQIIEQLENANLANTQSARLFVRELSETNNDLQKAFENVSKVTARNNETVSEMNTLISELIRGKTKSIPKNEIQKLIGTIARNDETYADMLRSVDRSVSMAPAARLPLYINETLANPSYRNLFLRGIASQKAMKDVFEATSDIDAFDNLVALTRNTYAGKGVAKEIMDAAKEADIAKISKELAERFEPRFVGVQEAVVGKTGETVVKTSRTTETPSRVVAAFDITDEFEDRIVNVVEQLRRFNRISNEAALPIIRRVRNEKLITTRDLRTIIDAEIDAIAAARAAKDTKSVLSATDVSRLPITNQLDLLEPLESRTFVKRGLRKVYNALTGRKIAKGNLSLGQRRLLQRAQEELQNLDIKLRKDMQKMASDEEFRRLHAGGVPVKTRSDALAYLIVGPKTSEEIATDVRLVEEASKLSREILDIEAKINNILKPYNFTIREFEKADVLIKKADRNRTRAQIPITKQIEKIESDLTKARQEFRKGGPNAFAINRIIKDLESDLVEQKALLTKTEEDFNKQVTETQIERHIEIFEDNPQLVNLFKDRQFVFEQAFEEQLAMTATRRSMLERLVDSLIDNVYISEGTKENVFDVFVGTSRQGNNSILTLEGKEQLANQLNYKTYDEMVNDMVDVMYREPTKIWSLMVDIDKAYKNIITAVEATSAFTKRDSGLFRYPMNTLKSAFNNHKIPKEWQVSAYYRAQAQNIADDLMADIINKDLRETNFRIENALSDRQIEDIGNFYNQLSMMVRTEELLPQQVQYPINTNAVVKNRLQEIAANDDIYDAPRDIDFDTISEIFPFAGLEARLKEYAMAEPGTRFLMSEQQFIESVENFVRKPENISIIAPLLEAGDEIAKSILARNGFVNTTPSINAMERIIKDLESDEIFEQLRLMYGDNVAKQLRESFEDSFDQIRKDTMDLIERRDATGSEKLKNTVSDIGGAFLNLRYLILLNLRPRFHGANLMTGADIYYKTIGRIPDFRDVFEGANVLLNRNPNKIIFTDGAGRSFTSDELNDILLKSTGKSVYGLDLPAAKAKRLRNIISDVETKPKEALRIASEAFEVFKELPQYEDLLFRYAALKAALKEGRSMDEAIALAQRSMFDSSNITSAEKQFKNLFLFYGFQRQNLITTAENMFTGRGIKRLAKAARIVNNLNQAFTSKETAQYSPSYAQTRVILDSIDFDPDKGKSLIVASAPLASLDGVYAFADMLKLQPQGFFGGTIRPEFKSLLGIEDKFDREFTRVPAEHIYFLDSLGFDPIDVINLIVGSLGGEQVVPVPVSEERQAIEGAYKGVVYPLSTPKQKAAYKLFFDAISYAAVTTTFTDYARTMGAEGTRVAFLGEQKGLPNLISYGVYGTALGTPYVSMSPERQAYYDRLSRLRELRGTVSAIRAEENRRMREEAPPEAIEQQEEIQEARQEIQQRRAIQPTRAQRTKLEISREIKTIKIQLRTGAIDPATARARLLELQAEYRALPQ